MEALLSTSRPIRALFAIGFATAFVTMSPGKALSATCQSWGAQPPNRSGENSFYGVAATSKCNAWAVGDSGSLAISLIEHWNGRAWTIQANPNPGTGGTKLNGVAAISSTKAWAVGGYYKGTAYHTLVEHWNGTSWKRQSSPSVGSRENILQAVATSSASDAWAVGYHYNGTADQTLILHWNGMEWKRVKSPNPGGPSHDNYIRDVAVVSPSNAWAVGIYDNGTATRTLILHWNGTSWKKVPSPNGGNPSRYNFLEGVSAASSADVWAVGIYEAPRHQTLILHWNGKAWRKVKSPSPGGASGDNQLWDVAATSATNAWAVGSHAHGSAAHQTLILHWNGTSWAVQRTPNPAGSSLDDDLYGVAAASSRNAWAVGTYNNGSGDQTLALHCC